jgi:LPS sulfotransferase NodH
MVSDLNQKPSPMTTENIIRFVIFAVPRSGSNWLCSLLNSHPEILCHHEIFNPERMIYSTTYPEGHFNFGTVEERDCHPLAVYQQIWQQSQGYPVVGFKLNRGQNQVIFEQVLQEKKVKKIILKRQNQVRTFVSEMIAEKTQEWESYPWSKRSQNTPSVYVDLEKLHQHIQTNHNYFKQITETLTTSNQSYLESTYEQIFDPTEHRRILDFLGVENSNFSLTAITSKQNTQPLQDLIVNFEELVQSIEDPELKAELFYPGF